MSLPTAEFSDVLPRALGTRSAERCSMSGRRPDSAAPVPARVAPHGQTGAARRRESRMPLLSLCATRSCYCL